MIKRIERKYIPECVELIRASFLTVAEQFGFTVENAPRFTAFATSEERLYWQYDNGRPMFAYFSEGKIVGYYSLELKENSECELNNLCVLPEYRHRKIGEELLAHAFVEGAKSGYEKMVIGIVEENTVLRRWYEKQGFVHVGVQKFDFFPFTCGYLEKRL